MNSEFDLGRLAELQRLLGTDLAAIVATLLTELSRALAEIDAALARDDLSAAALGAHAARNSALMIDARPLLGHLGELESSARRDDPPPPWPPTSGCTRRGRPCGGAWSWPPASPDLRGPSTTCPHGGRPRG